MDAFGQGEWVLPGVPPQLMALCHVTGNEEPFVLVTSAQEASLPGLDRLPDLGVTAIRIASVDTFDLRWLGDALARFRSITFASHMPLPRNVRVDTAYVGIQALRGARALERLQVGVGLAEPVDLSELPNLRVVHCAGDFALSAARNMHVRDLYVEVSKLPSGFRVEPPLERLVIYAGKSMRDLSFVQNASSVRELAIGEAATFDVSSLSGFTSLRRLTFDGCKDLTGMSVLRSLSKLEFLEIVGARTVEGAETLLGLGIAEFVVESNYAFDEDFQLAAVDRSGWRIGRQRTPNPAKVEALPTIASGTDEPTIGSVDPFEIEPAGDDGYVLIYNDWADLANSLARSNSDVGVDSGELVAVLIGELFPAERFDLDLSEAGVRVYFPDLQQASLVGTKVASAWRDKRRLRAIAKRVGA